MLDCVGLDSAAVINTDTIPSLHSNSVETENQMSAKASTSAVNASSSSEDGFHFTGDCLFKKLLFGCCLTSSFIFLAGEVLKSLLNATENGKVILGKSGVGAKNSFTR